MTAAALMVGMAVATSTLTVALEGEDRLAREFQALGANLVVTPKADTLPLEVGGVDYRPVDEGSYLKEADLGKLKMIFWRNNILGFTPFLDVPANVNSKNETLIGTWYQHDVAVPDGTTFKTGLSATQSSWKIQGRWFGDGSGEAVVGASLAASDPADFAIGKTIQVAKAANAQSTEPLMITGIVTTGGAEDGAILVPLTIAQGIAGHPGEYRQLLLSAWTKPADALAMRDPKTMTGEEYDKWYCSPYISSISYQIENVIPGTSVRAIRKVAETEGRVLSRISSLLWIVTIAALIAAGLAVAATSATTVIERRAEIGIMKAIGATNFVVTSIFLVEQLLLAIAGGSIGFGLGLIIARELGVSVFGSPAPARLVVLPVVLALAAIVAIAGSMVPLRRAAHFRPAPILRGE
ncbi:MAG TPA: ABC transporter permease [Candidatus Acidoferrales bacterium]|nr:ABC transporter permease [Candidatus Acidoferrales bacterium]